MWSSTLCDELGYVPLDKAGADWLSTSYVTVRDHAMTVGGGTVTGARRVDGRSDLWELTVAPSGTEEVTLQLPARPCTEEGALCTADDRSLANGLAHFIPGPPPPSPLTASFLDVPDQHDGSTPFKLRLEFRAPLAISYVTLRDVAVTATGGTVTGARRVDGRNDLWELTVAPSGTAAVTVTLSASAACGEPGAVCTADDRALGNSPSAAVLALPQLSVADAEAEEGPSATMVFEVTLDRAASSSVTVDWATSDGTATAGSDYTAASGTLRFTAGQMRETVTIYVLDDSHDDDGETFTLVLSNPSGVRIADGEATGTIKNRDPLPRALLARTAAVHVVEHVEERLRAPREPGFEGRVAGRALRKGIEREMALELLGRLGAAVRAPGTGGGFSSPVSSAPGAGGPPPTASIGSPGLGGPMGAPTAGAMHLGGPMDGPMTDGPFGGGLLAMGLGSGNMLTGSAFVLNRETRQGGSLSFWSRGAQSSFSGREGELGLAGDVRTTMLGTDYAKGPMVVGLSLANTRGLGSYDGVSAGQVALSVKGLYPWLGYELTDRVSVWGVTGYGSGGMLLTPAGGPTLESGLSMKMAAAGTRGELVAGGSAGFGLAFKADALWVGTSVEGVNGPAGRLAATAATVSRVRTALEGSRGFALRGRLSLTPSVEVGLRHDAGDAETGAGMDVGAGLIASDAATGLAVDVRVRTLLVHQDAGFRERGVSISLSYNPTPAPPLGMTALVAPSWGGQPTSGSEALWGRPRDDGWHGPGRRRAGQPDGCRGRLRAPRGAPLRGNAEIRPADVAVRPGLPGGLQPRCAEPGEPGVRAGGRGAAP